jgi:hypothetical protein
MLNHGRNMLEYILSDIVPEHGHLSRVYHTTLTITELAPGYPSTLITTLTGNSRKNEEYTADLTEGLETSRPFASTETSIVYATATITGQGMVYPSTLTITFTGKIPAIPGVQADLC